MKKRLFILFIILTLLLTSCFLKEDNNQLKQYTINLGNYFSVSPNIIIECNEEFYNTKKDDIYLRLRNILSELDGKFNVHIPDSLISKINKHSGIKEIECDDEFIYVLKKAIEISDKTSIDNTSMYDISIYPVFELWDFENNYYFYNNYALIPDSKLIKEKLRLVSYKDIIIKTNSVFLKRKGAKIDLGSIVKAYACNKIFLELKDYGLNSGLIDVGGNIVSFGLKHSNNKASNYRIGIKTPFVSEIQKDYNLNELNNIKIIGYIEANETKDSFSTSGIYERYIKTEDNKMYHHILSPIDGFPIDNDIVSISVFSEKDFTVLDALSTALFALGREKAIKFCNQNDINCVIITKDRSIHLSENAKDRFVFNELLRKSGYYISEE